MTRLGLRRAVVFLAAVVIAIAFGFPGHAATDKAGSEKAREHFKSGEAFFKLEKYKEALDEYEQGYMARSDASFLYNIAQCHRLMGNKTAALRFYRRFLDEATRVLFEITSVSGHDLVGARVALCRVPLRLRHRAFDESKCAGAIELVPGSVSWAPALQRSGPFGLLVDSRNASRPLLVVAGRLQVVWSAPNGKLAAWLPWREVWQLAR